MEGVGTSGVPSSNHTASSEAIPAARPGSGAASDSLHGSSGSAQSWNSKSSRLFSSPQNSYKPRYKMEHYKMVSKLPQRLHPKGYKPGFLQQRNSRSQEDIVRPLEQVSSRPSSAGISLTPLQGHNNAPADYMEQNAVSKSQASLAPLSSNLNPSVDISKSAPMSFPRHLATAPLMRPRLDENIRKEEKTREPNRMIRGDALKLEDDFGAVMQRWKKQIFKFKSNGNGKTFKEGIAGWDEDEVQHEGSISFRENPSWNYVEENETIASTTRDNIRDVHNIWSQINTQVASRSRDHARLYSKLQQHVETVFGQVTSRLRGTSRRLQGAQRAVDTLQERVVELAQANHRKDEEHKNDIQILRREYQERERKLVEERDRTIQMASNANVSVGAFHGLYQQLQKDMQQDKSKGNTESVIQMKALKTISRLRKQIDDQQQAIALLKKTVTKRDTTISSAEKRISDLLQENHHSSHKIHRLEEQLVILKATVGDSGPIEHTTLESRFYPDPTYFASEELPPSEIHSPRTARSVQDDPSSTKDLFISDAWKHTENFIPNQSKLGYLLFLSPDSHAPPTRLGHSKQRPPGPLWVANIIRAVLSDRMVYEASCNLENRPIDSLPSFLYSWIEARCELQTGKGVSDLSFGCWPQRPKFRLNSHSHYHPDKYDSSLISGQFEWEKQETWRHRLDLFSGLLALCGVPSASEYVRDREIKRSRDGGQNKWTDEENAPPFEEEEEFRLRWKVAKSQSLEGRLPWWRGMTHFFLLCIQESFSTSTLSFVLAFLVQLKGGYDLDVFTPSDAKKFQVEGANEFVSWERAEKLLINQLQLTVGSRGALLVRSIRKSLQIPSSDQEMFREDIGIAKLEPEDPDKIDLWVLLTTIARFYKAEEEEREKQMELKFEEAMLAHKSMRAKSNTDASDQHASEGDASGQQANAGGSRLLGLPTLDVVQFAHLVRSFCCGDGINFCKYPTSLPPNPTIPQFGNSTNRLPSFDPKEDKSYIGPDWSQIGEMFRIMMTIGQGRPCFSGFLAALKFAGVFRHTPVLPPGQVPIPAILDQSLLPTRPSQPSEFERELLGQGSSKSPVEQAEALLAARIPVISASYRNLNYQLRETVSSEYSHQYENYHGVLRRYVVSKRRLSRLKSSLEESLTSTPSQHCLLLWRLLSSHTKFLRDIMSGNPIKEIEKKLKDKPPASLRCSWPEQRAELRSTARFLGSNLCRRTMAKVERMTRAKAASIIQLAWRRSQPARTSSYTSVSFPRMLVSFIPRKWITELKPRVMGISWVLDTISHLYSGYIRELTDGTSVLSPGAFAELPMGVFGSVASSSYASVSSPSPFATFIGAYFLKTTGDFRLALQSLVDLTGNVNRYSDDLNRIRFFSQMIGIMTPQNTKDYLPVKVVDGVEHSARIKNRDEEELERLQQGLDTDDESDADQESDEEQEADDVEGDDETQKLKLTESSISDFRSPYMASQYKPELHSFYFVLLVKFLTWQPNLLHKDVKTEQVAAANKALSLKKQLKGKTPKKSPKGKSKKKKAAAKEVFLSKEDLNPFKVPTPMPLPTTLFVDNTPELVKQAVVESEAKAETEEKAEKPDEGDNSTDKTPDPGGLTVDTSSAAENITPNPEVVSPRSPRSQKPLTGVHTIAQSHASEFLKLCFEEADETPSRALTHQFDKLVRKSLRPGLVELDSVLELLANYFTDLKAWRERHCKQMLEKTISKNKIPVQTIVYSRTKKPKNTAKEGAPDETKTVSQEVVRPRKRLQMVSLDTFADVIRSVDPDYPERHFAAMCFYTMLERNKISSSQTKNLDLKASVRQDGKILGRIAVRFGVLNPTMRPKFYSDQAGGSEKLKLLEDIVETKNVLSGKPPKESNQAGGVVPLAARDSLIFQSWTELIQTSQAAFPWVTRQINHVVEKLPSQNKSSRWKDLVIAKKKLTKTLRSDPTLLKPEHVARAWRQFRTLRVRADELLFLVNLDQPKVAHIKS